MKENKAYRFKTPGQEQIVLLITVVVFFFFAFMVDGFTSFRTPELRDFNLIPIRSST